MKIQRLFTKAFCLVLVCVTVMVVAVFRLSPGLAARSTTTPLAQPLATETTIAQSGGKSLYQRLGGYNAIAAVIDDTAQYVFNDPLIGKYFIGLSTNSKQRLRQFLVDQFCQATGGPCIYTGRSMKLSHNGIGTGLTNQEFDAFANAVERALKDNGVNRTEREEVLSFVNSLKGDIVEK